MIKPYARRPPALEPGLILGSGEIAPGDQIYVSFDLAHELLLAQEAEAVCWNGDPIRLRYRGVEAIVLRSEVPADDDELLDALHLWRDWLAGSGARIGSFGSAAWSALRASLREPVRTSWGDVPPLRGVIGGRQELRVRPGRYEADLSHYDLRSSYPAAISRLAYGGAWAYLDVPLAKALDLASAGVLVYVSAIVRYPAGLAIGPLPSRPRGQTDSWRSFLQPTYYPTKTVAGYWTAPEIAAAIEAGARIRHRGTWIHAAPSRPFLGWWDVMQAGRELAGFASQLAKITANALWGQLCISHGERQVLSFKGGVRRVRPEPLRGAGRPRMFDLAEYVTGSVRARLYSELLAPCDVLTAHTDGGWVRSGAPTAEGWRLKDRARILYVINPQALAYVRPSGELVYRLAGVPSRYVAQTFGELWRTEVGSEPPTLAPSAA